MRQRVRWAAIVLAVGLVVGGIRFLGTRGYTDDHYVHLAGAQQILFGEWPSRDFVDLGAPLQFMLSAANWAIFGESLFTEVVLVSVLFAVAAMLTAWAGVRLTGSMALALLAVALEFVMFPRSYSYPKLILYAAGVLLMWRYVVRPTYWRIVHLAAFVVVAFLMRHDHGVYLGMGGAAAVALGTPGGVRPMTTRVAAYVVIGLAFVAPYFAYLSFNGGLIEHFAAGVVVNAVERERTRLPWPAFTMAGWTGNAGPWLFYLFHALPIVAALIAPRERRAWIWPLAVVAVLANVGMIRDKLDVRLPDVIVPASLLLIWVATRLWTITSGAGAMALRALVVAIVLATGAATLVVGNTSEQLGRAAMFSSSRSLPGRFVDHAAELRQRFPAAQVPSATVAALIPFMAWADRCLGDGDHILVPHFLPEVAVWARQPFAGGQVWYQAVVLDRPQDHRLVIQRLSRQRVPVAVLELEDAPYFDIDFPELARYLERFTEPQRFTMREGQVIEVRFDPSFIRSRDAETGWPCYL